MRKACVAALLLLLCPSSAFPEDATTEAWYRAQTAPSTPTQTRYDTLLVTDVGALMVRLQANTAAGHLSGSTFWLSDKTAKSTRLDAMGKPETVTSDTTVLASDWIRVSALWPLRRGGAESFFTTPAGISPPSALELASDDTRVFERIDFRLVVKIFDLPNKTPLAKRRGLRGGDRTVVIASAQFMGLPYEERAVPDSPAEIRSSGLIERDFFERLRGTLNLK